LQIAFFFVSLHKNSTVMNPILLYPQNATQAKFFQESAEKQGVEMVHLPQKLLDDMEDWFFGAKLYELSKTAEFVSEDEMMALFDRKLNGK